MKRGFIAATAYFPALFALGFVLGVIRTLVVAPRIGPLAATIAEVPFMLTAAFFLCRRALRHWRVPPDASIRWVMAAWFMALLLVVETLLGTALFGRTVAETWATLSTPAGLVGLAAQLVVALLQLVLGGPRSPGLPMP